MNTTQETEFDYQKHMKESSRGPSEINRGTKAREKRREAAKARISQNGQLSRVLEKVQEIVEKSADGDYIYRGEPEHYEKVSSSLYRKYSDIDTEHFDIEIIQNEILEAAKRYTSETDDFEILTELQHYGGATNLIDFTTDYLIAIFFACEGSDFLYKDGRVILLRKTMEINRQIESPQNPKNRVIAQKSIFVRPPYGFIEPDHIISIPKYLKSPILDYLLKYHGISTETIYNDLHGFIRYQNVHQSASAEFYAGFTYQNEQNCLKAIEHYSKAIELNPRLVGVYNNRGAAYDSNGELDRAIADYDKAIELNPEFARAYYNRGVAYSRKGELDWAIKDYDKAIELNPKDADAYNNRGAAYSINGEFDWAIKDYDKAIDLNIEHTEVYCNRGMSWLSLQNWQKAKSDLTFAKSIGMDIITAFRNIYGTVDEFEKKNGIKLPKDIAAMLRP
ncbi:MAG: tetratricopeptide repeat protein [Gemmatimonadetes bacterium]|nr:tetratricopeptide repeat protein [Gemmatimonadota bacterium]